MRRLTDKVVEEQKVRFDELLVRLEKSKKLGKLGKILIYIDKNSKHTENSFHLW